MDPTIEQMIAGYRMGIDSFAGNLGADHPLVQEARGVIAQLEAIGESSGDVVTFMGASSAPVEALSGLMERLASAKPATPPAGSGTPAASVVPEVAQAAAAYHQAYDAMDKGDPEVRRIYERIFELEGQAPGAAAFTRMLAEERLLTLMSSVGLRSAMAKGRAAGAGAMAFMPTADHYYATFDREMAQAVSPTHVEYIATLQAAYNGVENEWDALLRPYLSAAIGAVAGFYMDQSAHQKREVVAAYRFVCSFFGLTWDQVYQVPRARDDFAAQFGVTKSAWASQRGCHTVEEAWAFHTRTFHGIMQDQRVDVASVPLGPAAYQQVVLWGTPVHVNDLLEAFRDPPRPPVDLTS